MASAIQPPKPPGAPKPVSLGANNEFDLARRRAQEQENQTLAAQKDALARRAAMLGGGVSGALLKQEQLATDESAKRLASANEAVDTAQRAEERRLGEAQQQLDMQRYGIDTQRDMQKYGVDTSRDVALEGQKIQKYGIDVQKVLGEGGLLGVYNGKDTLQKTQGDRANAISEAGITGVYKGSPTLAGKAYADSNAQNAFENKVNVPTLVGTTIGNLKTQGYKDEQIRAIVESLFGGINLQDLGIDIGSLLDTFQTPKPPPQPVITPPTNTQNNGGGSNRGYSNRSMPYSSGERRG